MIGGWWLTSKMTQATNMFHDQNCLLNPTCLYELQSSTKPTTFQMNKWTSLVAEPTHLKNIGQTWIISPGRAKKFKFVWNHHLDLDLDKLKVLFFKTTLSTLKCRCNDSLPFYLQEGLSDDMKKFRLALCLAWHSTQEPLQMPLFCLFFFFWGGVPNLAQVHCHWKNLEKPRIKMVGITRSVAPRAERWRKVLTKKGEGKETLWLSIESWFL